MKFTHILTKLILENTKYDILKKAYTEPKKKGDKEIPAKMSLEYFEEIIKADPTSVVENDEIKKAGKYTKWLLKQFMQLNPDAEYGTEQYDSQLKVLRDRFIEDLYKTTTDLKKFDRFKNNIDVENRDINRLNLTSLYNLVKDFELTNKASKEDKKEAASTYEFKGSKVIYRGANWTVVEIEGTSSDAIEAAKFFGGNHMEPQKGETRWCTSSPGLNYGESHLRKGPLYVVIPNSPTSFYNPDITTGEVSGLPALRYQFHFETNQFMDPADHQIDLVQFLQNNPELKETFKPKFTVSFQDNNDESKFIITYPHGALSKYIALYGFDGIAESIPKNINRFDFKIDSNQNTNIDLSVPKNIGDFKEIRGMHLSGISEIPESIGNLKNLKFLALTNSPKLNRLPDSFDELDSLRVINVAGSPNIEFPPKTKEKIEKKILKIFTN